MHCETFEFKVCNRETPTEPNPDSVQGFWIAAAIPGPIFPPSAVFRIRYRSVRFRCSELAELERQTALALFRIHGYASVS